MPYWVLHAGSYPDTRSGYDFAKAKRDVVPLDFGYLDNPVCHVFDGTRTPWLESDPYPDFVVEFGPRGGIRWSPA